MAKKGKKKPPVGGVPDFGTYDPNYDPNYTRYDPVAVTLPTSPWAGPGARYGWYNQTPDWKPPSTSKTSSGASSGTAVGGGVYSQSPASWNPEAWLEGAGIAGAGGYTPGDWIDYSRDPADDAYWGAVWSDKFGGDAYYRGLHGSEKASWERLSPYEKTGMAGYWEAEKDRQNAWRARQIASAANPSYGHRNTTWRRQQPAPDNGGGAPQNAPTWLNGLVNWRI